LQAGGHHHAIHVDRDRRERRPGPTCAVTASFTHSNRSAVVIVKALSQRLTVRALGTTRNWQNRRTTGSSPT
jgi:hypothetical protein